MANEGDDEPSFVEGSLPPEFSEIHDGTLDFEKMENAVLSSPEMHRRTNFTAGINARAHVEPGHFDTEKQQLLHDLHLCKMEISKKVLQMDNMKADRMALVNEMEERLQEAEHQRKLKKLLQTKLDSQQNVHSSAHVTIPITIYDAFFLLLKSALPLVTISFCSPMQRSFQNCFNFLIFVADLLSEI